MNRYILLLIVLLLSGSAFMGCREPVGNQARKEQTHAVDLTLQIALNKQLYQDSRYGNPPQLAIWLENQEDHSIRTVMVTYRMGACDWNGKVECGVALPYWVGFYNRQTGTTGPPTREHPAPDAITYATPKDQLTIRTRVPENSRWSCFIEVNVSGDFNADFPALSGDGRKDRNGNGQPSVVYRGTIEAVGGAISRPAVLGHTDQYEPVAQLTESTEGITTALELLKTITVSCR